MNWHSRSTLYAFFGTLVIVPFLIFEIIYYSDYLHLGPKTILILPDNRDLDAVISGSITGSFNIKSGAKSYVVKTQVFKSWFENYERSYTGRKEIRPNYKIIAAYISKLAPSFETSPINPRLTVDALGEIHELTSPIQGKKLNVNSSVANVFSATMKGRNWSELVFENIEPQITLEKIKKIGISDRLAVGQSNFLDSPKARIHNIKTGLKLFNNIIVKPGEEFSFNNWLGPVTATAGYQPELVIKSNKIIPEYGGGLCQVSTTLFRAVMTAGLPILERRPHALSVRYYNPQGFDATIYPGVTDLRFKNDTPGYLLIQSETRGATISFQIFGSDDGRKISINGPRIYEKGPDGSMKTVLNRTIISSGGQKQNDTFWSSYKSPALYPIIRDPLE